MKRHRPRLLRVFRVQQRLWSAWLDDHAGAWLPLIPSWGTSLLVHGLALLVLALYIYVYGGRSRPDQIEGRFASQLRDDVTSLVKSDHAGDPFTKVRSDEPPSLSLTPPKPEDTAISQPEVPALARFAPDLATPEPSVPEDSRTAPPLADAAAPVRGLKRALARPNLSTVVTNLHVEDMSAPFSGRGEAVRTKLVRREGGTVESEKAVESGLAWIVRHQRADGSWSLNYGEACQGDTCPPEQCIDSDTAATGLALLPLLGAGHIHTAKSRYQLPVGRGLEWLVANQQPTGELYLAAGGIARMYSHAIASMALCEAYGLSNDPKLRAPAQKAIDFIIQSQNAESGGWRYMPGQYGDTSVFGWMMFALRSARLAGLRVPPSVVAGCRSYADLAATDRKKVTYSYQPGRGISPVMTAEALLARQYLGWPKTHPSLVKGANMVARHLSQSDDRNIYYWYYATQLLHNMQNDDWKAWNVRVRDGLVAMQVKGAGCARGSWDPVNPQPDEWARSDRRIGAGRLYLTALSILTLEVYYRYLPLYQPTDLDRAKLEDDTKPAPAEK